MQILRTADVFLSLQRFAKLEEPVWNILELYSQLIMIWLMIVLSELRSGCFCSLEEFIIFSSGLQFNDFIIIDYLFIYFFKK